MANLDYHVYMQKVDVFNESGTAVTQPVYDLELHWRGLLYQKCEGLNDKGKKTSAYTEEYADSDNLRHWESETLAREASEIMLTLFFVGNNKQALYDSFYDYIKQGHFYYVDDQRNKLAYVTLMDAIKLSEEKFVGGTTYYKAEIKFQNLWGECHDGTSYVSSIRNIAQ